MGKSFFLHSSNNNVIMDFSSLNACISLKVVNVFPNNCMLSQMKTYGILTYERNFQLLMLQLNNLHLNKETFKVKKIHRSRINGNIT